MFVGVFDPEQVKSFVNLAYRVMLADEKVTKDEEDLITFLEMVVPFDPQIINVSLTLDDLIKPFNDTQSKIFCLLNLYIMALVDEEYAAKEKQLIDEIALKFGIGPDVNSKLLKTSTKLVESFKEIRSLLEAVE